MDAIPDGSQTSIVTVSVDAANSDDDFDSVTDQTVTVVTTDDSGGVISGTKFEDLDGDGQT